MTQHAPDTIFAVRPGDLAHDTIDGETVVIDLLHGVYYRFEGAAALLWGRLADGARREELTALVESRYDADAARISGEVDRFLAELGAEGLVQERPDDRLSPAPSATVAEARLAFAGLALHRFSDLQELFWIDPVHDVDETGWPQRPAGT